MLTRIRQTFLLILLLSGASFAETESVRASFSSGEHRVALIELFTSEGCNSCPPADRWLSDLKHDPGLWTDFAPIALHVDYWNYIGWRDRFSRTEYSDRQKRYVAEGGARFVYTPSLFRDGQEWQRWRVAEPEPADESIVGSLNVVVDGQDVAVHFAADSRRDSKMMVHVAVLGMNLETRVRAGETAGRTLQHDFVVLGVASTPLEPVAGGYRAVTSMPAPSIRHEELALAAWVSEAQNQAPIQAVGGYLSRVQE